MLLIANLANVLEADDTEQNSLLIAGEQIAAVLVSGEAQDLRRVRTGDDYLDGRGLIAVPGLIDMHMHITGGGGEAGPSSRVPEGQLSYFLDSGITTAVGVLGTDSVSRSQENLIAKCQALNAEGITCYHWCGGYRVPPATITGDVQKEMLVSQSCLGVGEIAVSDHRSSVPTAQQLAHMASEVRVGGMLSGKCGLLYCHMGGGNTGLQPLRDALALAEIPITQILPTHMSRDQALIDDGAKWLQDGGWLDFTAGDKAAEALMQLHGQNLPLERCTVSSDAFGSLPVFDEHGMLVSYDVGQPSGPLKLIQELVLKTKWPLPKALQFCTSNAARVLKLPRKGQIVEGMDADILLLDKTTLELRYVIAKGKIVRTPEWTQGGVFERGDRIRPVKPQL